jgi:hypothetical protein
VGGALGTNGRGEKVYKVLMRNSEVKRTLGKPRHRWEYGIRMYLREIGWSGIESIQLAQDKVVGGLL